MSEHDDAASIARCLEGEINAFEELVRRYEKPLYNGCLRIVGDSEDARDVVQTVFIKAYENLNNYDPNRKFFSWIYRMMVNAALNQVERKRPTSELDPRLASKELQPDESFASDRQSAQLQEALLQLQPEARVAVVLKYFGDLSYEELGFVLDIPPKTVKSRLYTARRHLCEIMSAQGMVTHGSA
jgi:RNA polymerase sigma-70 factor (ECF subfamily)